MASIPISLQVWIDLQKAAGGVLIEETCIGDSAKQYHFAAALPKNVLALCDVVTDEKGEVISYNEILTSWGVLKCLHKKAKGARGK